MSAPWTFAPFLLAPPRDPRRPDRGSPHPRLPIAGLKEKALAARRVDLRTLLDPKWNTVDVDEIPPQLRKELTFAPVERIDEVLACSAAAGGDGGAPAARRVSARGTVLSALPRPRHGNFEPFRDASVGTKAR